jgi:hypothetical protein
MLFVTKVSLNFWYFDTHEVNIVRKKMLDLYNLYTVVHDPKCFDQRWSGHWVKTLFSFIFVTFEKKVTNFRGTFIQVPISTHPNEESTQELQTHRRGIHPSDYYSIGNYYLMDADSVLIRPYYELHIYPIK